MLSDMTTVRLDGHQQCIPLPAMRLYHSSKEEPRDPLCHTVSLPFQNTFTKLISFPFSTGEKIHQCPDDIVGSSAQRCEYRTNDPAALSKHRKKLHGYVPPPNRTRLTKADPTAPRKPRDETVTRRYRRPQRSTSASRRRPSRVSRAINYPNGAPGYTSTSTENPSPFLTQGDVYGDAIDVDSYGEPGYNFTGATLIDSDEEMGLDTLYDPSLRSQWMAEYEEGYSTFDVTGMKYLPEPLHAVSSSAPVGFDMQTGREGCLCPEWMVEAGIEGWE